MIRLSTIKTLYANGCSFTSGSELEQECSELCADRAAGNKLDRDSRLFKYQQQHAWPSRLGKLAGIDVVVNEARGGGSNARAVRMTYDFVSRYVDRGENPAELLVCLGITDLARSERFDPDVSDEDRVLAGGWDLLKPNLPPPSNAAGRHSRKCNHAYYRFVYSELQSTLVFFHQLLGLQFMFTSLGARYYFHDAMSSNGAPIERWSNEVFHLERMLRINHYRSVNEVAGGRFGFDDRLSFEYWAQQSGVPLGQGGHPLSAGHEGWAKVLYDDITNAGILSEKIPDVPEQSPRLGSGEPARERTEG